MDHRDPVSAELRGRRRRGDLAESGQQVEDRGTGGYACRGEASVPGLLIGLRRAGCLAFVGPDACRRGRRRPSEPPPNSPKTRQKLGQNHSRASEPRTRVPSTGIEVPGNAHYLPSRVTRPRGFEPLTFGSVVGASTGPRGLFPRGIACTDASIEVTRAATRGHARTRFVPTSFPPLRVADGASRLHPRAPEAAGHRRR
jgi:hypothetical protein